MELFGSIARGSAGSLTEEEIRALEGEEEGAQLPEGTQAHLLAETARSILGLKPGKEKEREGSRRKGEEER